MKDCITSMPMKDFVTWVCLIYAIISLFVFWIMTYRRNKTLGEVRAAAEKKRQELDFSAEGVLEKASKLVEAFTKAGPAISSLGASIVALGFASYIVAQPAKDQDKPNSGTGQTTQSAPNPNTK